MAEDKFDPIAFRKKIITESATARAREQIEKDYRKELKEKQREKVSRTRGKPATRYLSKRERKEKIYLRGKESTELKKLRIEQKQKKQRTELKTLRFAKTRTGKAGEFLKSVVRARQQQLQTARLIRQSPINSRMQFARQQFSQQQQRQNFLNNNIGWEAHFVAPALEKEISNVGGVGWEGSRAANSVGREAGQFANLSTPFRVAKLEAEINAHARNTNFSPALNIDAEVFSFANILNPRLKRRR